MVLSSLAFLNTRTFLLYTWQNCAEPLSPFPLRFAFPEHIPGEHVAPYHKEIKQIFHHWREAEMYISTVWLRSLAEVNKWLTSLEDLTTSVRLLSDFSTLKICAALQGRASQLGSIASTGCTTPIGSALPLLLSHHLQSPAPAPLWPQASVQLHHRWYIHMQKLPSPNFTAWKLNILFLKEHPLFADPSIATAIILALHLLQGIGLLSPQVSIPRLKSKKTISLVQTKTDIWWPACTISGRSHGSWDKDDFLHHLTRSQPASINFAKDCSTKLTLFQLGRSKSICLYIEVPS